MKEQMVIFNKNDNKAAFNSIEYDRKIKLKKLNDDNFNQNTLDGFIRHQAVKECWRKINGEWQLVPNEFEENWSLRERREIAEDVARHMNRDQTAFGAFHGHELAGFLTVSSAAWHAM